MVTDGEALKILRIASYSGCYRLGYEVMLSLRDIDGTEVQETTSGE